MATGEIGSGPKMLSPPNIFHGEDLKGRANLSVDLLLFPQPGLSLTYWFSPQIRSLLLVPKPWNTSGYGVMNAFAGEEDTDCSKYCFSNCTGAHGEAEQNYLPHKLLPAQGILLNCSVQVCYMAS